MCLLNLSKKRNMLRLMLEREGLAALMGRYAWTDVYHGIRDLDITMLLMRKTLMHCLRPRECDGRDPIDQ